MITLDTREFGRAMQFVIETTGKDSADVLNRGGLHAIIGGKGVKGAMQRTAKADVSKIRALRGLPARRIVLAQARKRGERLTRDEITQRARKLVNSRISAVNYTRGPGWSKAAQALGGRGARTSNRFAQSEARKGYGKKATARRLETVIANTAPAAPKIGMEPLQAALKDVARDMTDYANRKLQKTFNKVKSR